MNFLKENRHWIILASIIIFVIAIDLITKSVFNEETVIIEGFLSIYPALNPGGAWGFLRDNSGVLMVMSIAVLATLAWINVTIKQRTKFFSIGMGLIVGGAFGNLFDRVVLGSVRDFIKLDFVTFPIFNFADVCLSIGSVMMIIYFLFLYKKEMLEKVEQ